MSDKNPKQEFNWAMATTVIAVLITIVMICGVCTWGATVYWRSN